jgi:hypothetical protein
VEHIPPIPTIPNPGGRGLYSPRSFLGRFDAGGRYEVPLSGVTGGRDEGSRAPGEMVPDVSVLETGMDVLMVVMCTEAYGGVAQGILSTTPLPHVAHPEASLRIRLGGWVRLRCLLGIPG